MELTIIFLGGTVKENYLFKEPGPMHHARWMSKTIYDLKIFIFRDQFFVSRADLRAIRDIAIFIVLLYVKAWMTASKPLSSPNNDLTFFQSLIQYKNENKVIGSAAIEKFAYHLWYLTEEIVGLALFDLQVPENEKRAILTSMKNNVASEIQVKRLPVNPNSKEELKMWENRKLHDLVSQKTLKLFTRFNINTEFLEKDPSTWKENSSFQTAKKVLSRLRVVNDTAERGVAMISKCNRHLTKDEEQLQSLVKVVAKNRQEVPEPKKSLL